MDNVILIFWDDLVPAKQQEILDTFGDNGNYDVIPLVQIPVSEEACEQ